MNINGQKEKIAILLSSHFAEKSGGAELQASYLCELATKNFDVHYVFLSREKVHHADDEIKLHPTKRFNLIDRFDNVKFPYGLKILKALNDIKPRYIYQRCASGLTGLAAHYARSNNCRFTFHIAHDSDIERRSAPWKRPWLIPEYRLIRLGIETADNVIAQTQFQATQVLKNYHRDCIIIPNGHPVPDDSPKPQDRVTLLWIANWKPTKQPELFIQLAEELGTENNVRFVMIGRNVGYETLAIKAEENNIEVTGEISHSRVNKLLAESHVLVNTSTQEGFSNTFIQAWMRRVPVVSLQVDPDDIIRDKRIGLCAHGEFSRLVQGTRTLIEDRNLREKMGTAAREYALHNFSLSNIKAILDLIVCTKETL